MEFRVERQIIEPGETLLIYTDGVTDARNEAAAPFTEARLLELLSPAADSAIVTTARIQAAVFQHTDGVSQFDDITVSAMHRSEKPGEQTRQAPTLSSL